MFSSFYFPRNPADTKPNFIRGRREHLSAAPGTIPKITRHGVSEQSRDRLRSRQERQVRIILPERNQVRTFSLSSHPRQNPDHDKARLLIQSVRQSTSTPSAPDSSARRSARQVNLFFDGIPLTAARSFRCPFHPGTHLIIQHRTRRKHKRVFRLFSHTSRSEKRTFPAPGSAVTRMIYSSLHNTPFSNVKIFMVPRGGSSSKLPGRG